MVRDIRRQTPSALPATTLDQGPLDVTLADSSVGIDAVSDSPPSSLGCGWRMWRVSPAHRASTYLYRGREACGMARITSSQRMAATSRRPGGPVRFGAPLGRGGVIGPAGPANFVVATLCFFCRGDSEGGGAGGGTQGCSGFPTTPRALTVWLGSHLGAVSHWRAWPPDVRAGPTHRCGTCLQAIVCCFPASLVGGGVASGTGRQQSLHHPPSPTLPKWGVAIPLRAPLRARPRDPALSPPVRGTPPPAQATATPPRATHRRNPRRVARLWWGWSASAVPPGVAECVLLAHRRRGKSGAGAGPHRRASTSSSGPTAVPVAVRRPFTPLFSTVRTGSVASLRRFSCDAAVAPVVPPLFCAGAAWPRSCIRGSHLATVPILLVGPLLSPPRHLSLLLPPLLKTFFC